MKISKEIVKIFMIFVNGVRSEEKMKKYLFKRFSKIREKGRSLWCVNLNRCFFGFLF